jgi:hypothetical protein
MAVKLSVMGAANRDGEFVAYFAAKRTQLREPEMVRVAGLPSADEAGLQGNKVAVSLVAITAWFRYGQGTLVDPTGPK